LAVELETNNKFEEAFKAYETALKLCPDYDEVYFHYGVAQFYANRIPDAKKFFEKTLVLNPKHQPALLNLGAISIGLNQLDISIDCFTKLINMGVRDYAVLRQLGEAYLRNQKFQDAINPLRDAIVLAPNVNEYAMTSAMLHLAYRCTGNLGYALAYFEEFVLMKEKMGQDEIDFYIDLADGFLEANIHEKATDYLHKAMAIDKDNEKIQNLSLKINNFIKFLENSGVKKIVNNARMKYEECRINLLRKRGDEDIVYMISSLETGGESIPQRIKKDKS